MPISSRDFHAATIIIQPERLKFDECVKSLDLSYAVHVAGYARRRKPNVVRLRAEPRITPAVPSIQ